jgi:ABC-type Fe3+/spermidine/putrescine transport system ATPase subunit
VALSVGYGSVPVLQSLDLDVGNDEVVAVLGPSGSGKSTLLAALAGFVRPSGGEVWLGGDLVAGGRVFRPPDRRDIGVVFQHSALWPHLTAIETVAYPLRRQGIAAEPARRRANELLDLVGVGDLAHRRPAELSGGQQQRIGLARALARAPALYLFDEPTAHLDTPLRAALTDELAQRRRATGAAAVYATHDAAEALAVADRVALLRDGALSQVGAPADVYERPADLWSARLTGPASVLDVWVHHANNGQVELAVAGEALRVAGGGIADGLSGHARALVRPEWAQLDGPLTGVVTRVAYRGSVTDYSLETPAGAVDVRDPSRRRAAVGDRVAWRLERVWLLPPDGADGTPVPPEPTQAPSAV